VRLLLLLLLLWSCGLTPQHMGCRLLLLWQWWGIRLPAVLLLLLLWCLPCAPGSSESWCHTRCCDCCC
jgi:hypothetical protein